VRFRHRHRGRGPVADRRRRAHRRGRAGPRPRTAPRGVRDPRRPGHRRARRPPRGRDDRGRGAARRPAGDGRRQPAPAGPARRGGRRRAPGAERVGGHPGRSPRRRGGRRVMSNPLVVVAATLGLIIASAFFVIIEFALLGARRHRLEADAARSPSARAAIRGLDELTVMLAGAQLGVTACTFALGAVTKPAVDAWLGPALSSLGAPAGVADVVSFALSLLLVTFLHLVAGEMAPKSW